MVKAVAQMVFNATQAMLIERNGHGAMLCNGLYDNHPIDIAMHIVAGTPVRAVIGADVQVEVTVINDGTSVRVQRYGASVRTRKTGHIYYNSPIESDDNCGTCDGGRCDSCEDVFYAYFNGTSTHCYGTKDEARTAGQQLLDGTIDPSVIAD